MVKKSINECVRNFRGLLCICIIITICSIFQNEVYAEAGNKVISTDGQWISDSVEDNVNYYYFSIPEAGLVTYYFQNYSKSGRCSLYSGDLAIRYGHIDNYGSATSPDTDYESHYMEAGSYCLKITRAYTEDNWTGNYRLKVEYSPAGNNEKEPNNGFETAMLISENEEVKGLLSDDDSIDFYKINVEDKKMVDFCVYGNNMYVGFILWNSDYVEVIDRDCDSGSNVISATLEPGTYYIKIYDEDDKGTYTIKYLSKVYVSDIKLKKSSLSLKKGGTYSLLKTIVPSNATNKNLEWTSTRESVATVDAKGKVKAVGTGIATIEVKSADEGDASASCVVIVTPLKEKVSSLSQGYSYYDGAYINVWSSDQDGANGFQYQWSTKKNMSKAKTKLTYYSSCKITGVKKNTKYYVRVRAYVESNGKKYYGPWSSVRSVKTSK